MKKYKALKPLRLPAALGDAAGVVEVAAGDEFTVSDEAAAYAGRFLRNRVTVGDVVELRAE